MAGSITTFDAYAIANGISYKTQEHSRPSRHLTTALEPAHQLPRPPIGLFRDPLVTTNISSASASAQPTSNLRRIERMKRQLRTVSLPQLGQAMLPDDTDTRRPDSIDTHPGRSVSRRALGDGLPVKRNLTQAFLDARSSPAQTTSMKTKVPFSPSLIEHLGSPQAGLLAAIPIQQSQALVPAVPTALTVSQAFHGTPTNPSQIGNDLKKDYSNSTWTCHCCDLDYSSMAEITAHLRDHHFVEADMATLTPDRDVITMVLARVKSEEHDFMENNEEVVRRGATSPSNHVGVMGVRSGIVSQRRVE